jgi:hypothetical protein
LILQNFGKAFSAWHPQPREKVFLNLVFQRLDRVFSALALPVFGKSAGTFLDVGSQIALSLQSFEKVGILNVSWGYLSSQPWGVLYQG